MIEHRKKIKPMCGNCVYCDDRYKNKGYEQYNFCNKHEVLDYIDPHQKPCEYYEDWYNPKYAKENSEYENK